MPLFLVQDSDRPMYVKAESFGDAVALWERLIAVENDLDPDDVDYPLGVQYVAPDDELIWK